MTAVDRLRAVITRAPQQLALALLVFASGCQTTPLTTTKEPLAIQFALKRARFEMNCPTATASVLSKETIRPPVMGPGYIAVLRAQFVIGVTGCDKRSTQVVICTDMSDGCYAADERG